MQAGFSNVFALDGGFNAWVRAGHALERKAGGPADMHL